MPRASGWPAAPLSPRGSVIAQSTLQSELRLAPPRSKNRKTFAYSSLRLGRPASTSCDALRCSAAVPNLTTRRPAVLLFVQLYDLGVGERATVRRPGVLWLQLVGTHHHRIEFVFRVDRHDAENHIHVGGVDP